MLTIYVYKNIRISALFQCYKTVAKRLHNYFKKIILQIVINIFNRVSNTEKSLNFSI